MASIPLPDLVRLSQLETRFSLSPAYTQHTRDVPGDTRERRRVRKVEKWEKIKELGRGTFGDVYLEECKEGGTEGELRAVKKIQKLDRSTYYRELEAIALFSHDKYEQCFVKSSGWYDDNENIYIAMEFLPHGDLYKQLTSRLPESEGQTIVFQLLEGLQFMHQNGFAHRDLKPANILVVCTGPDWWVKIADFGISKRAAEGLTALRTMTGTPAFTAPEVLGFTQSDSYTNAVDIWSLGVITFLILTGKTLFTDQRRLGQYVAGRFAFPLDDLLANKVSEQGCDFTKALMAPEAEDRPRVEICLQKPWLSSLACQTSETQIKMKLNNELRPLETKPSNSDIDASARWSTHNQTLPYRSTSMRADNVDLEPPALKRPGDQFSSFEAHNQEMLSPKSEITESTAKPGFEIFYQNLPARLEGHSEAVFALAFSPDGKILASGSRDAIVQLWDLATGARQARLRYSSPVYALAFSPDGKVLASGSFDATVRFWDPATGAYHATLNHSDPVYTLVFSPDGKVLAAGSGKTIVLWDLATRACQATLSLSGFARVFAFSPNSKVLATGSSNKIVQLWDPVTRACQATLSHSSYVLALAFSPDGKMLASGSRDSIVRLWDPATTEDVSIPVSIPVSMRSKIKQFFG